ncbi:MAG TPA: sigma 54-interacting transcriptional regulator [Polyangiaceae bacterium]
MASSAFDENSTFHHTKSDSCPPVPQGIALVVLEGQDVQRQFVLAGPTPCRVVIGKGDAVDIRITDREISRRHAAVELGQSGFRIADLKSTNGTFVDGVRIIEAFLQGGEIVRMGATVFRVDLLVAPENTPVDVRTSFGNLVGGSAEMRRLYPLCERLAASSLPVVIEGETGTGKEVLAESLHMLGPRAAKPFVVFDCTTVAPSLLESELFGHERGAFTGAVGRRIGVFEQAHGGTLLIDEIGDLALPLQAKLLRAIERSEIRRVGGEQSIRVDVRVISATRRNLAYEVQAGRFRDDLFHRLAVARIELPALRHRRGDVSLLAWHFARAMNADPSKLSSELLARWNDAPWPGNVRELKNAVSRHIELGDLGGEAPAAPLLNEAVSEDEDPIARVIALGLPLANARQRLVDEFERRYIQQALDRHNGCVSDAAASAGVARRYFQLLRAKKENR